MSWEQGAFCLLFLRGGFPWCWLPRVCWGSGHGAELQQEHCSSSAQHREPEHSSPAELPALNICNSKYEIFVSRFFFPQHVKKEALLIDFSAIFLWHMPWHCSTDAITSNMVQKYSFSKPCDCSQEAQTSHNYSKRSVEENHILMLYLEEVSMCKLMFISTLVIWCSISSSVVCLDMVLVNCCAGLCSDGTASPCPVAAQSSNRTSSRSASCLLFVPCVHTHEHNPPAVALWFVLYML